MSPGKKILFVFHGVALTGASVVLFRYISFLRAHKNFTMAFLVPGKGKLSESLESCGSIFYYGKRFITDSLITRVIKKAGWKSGDPEEEDALVLNAVASFQPDIVYANTVATAPVVRLLKNKTSVPVTWHIHELELAMHMINIDPAKELAVVDRVIANSESTADFLAERFSVDRKKMFVHYPVLPSRAGKQPGTKNFHADRFVVGSCGTALPQKGAFLFVELAGIINRKYPGNNFQFVWVGNHRAMKEQLEYDIQQLGLDNIVTFTGEQDDPVAAFREFDFFISTSKEESFGLAPMEAAAVGVPLGGFERTGGMEQLLRKCDGLLVPYLDLEKMAEALVKLSREKGNLAELSGRAQALAVQFQPENIVPGWIETLLVPFSETVKPGSQ